MQELALMCRHGFEAKPFLCIICGKDSKLAFLVSGPFWVFSEESECFL